MVTTVTCGFPQVTAQPIVSNIALVAAKCGHYGWRLSEEVAYGLKKGVHSASEFRAHER